MFGFSRYPIDVKSVLNHNTILQRQLKDQRREIDRMEHCLLTARQMIVSLGKSNRELEAHRRQISKADLVLKMLRIIFDLVLDKVPHRKPGDRQKYYDEVDRKIDEVGN